jgi:hypothetical protein
MRFQCGGCGEEHDLHEMEPSFSRPDAYFAIPEAERGARSFNEQFLCVIWETECAERRHFLRGLLPFQIRGEHADYCWGIWIEVDAASFARAHDQWDLPDRECTTFAGQLGNELSSSEVTLGSRGRVQINASGLLPHFYFSDSVHHSFAKDQRHGVYAERAMEWASRAVHGHPAA